jgi:hypothetical protein
MPEKARGMHTLNLKSLTDRRFFPLIVLFIMTAIHAESDKEPFTGGKVWICTNPLSLFTMMRFKSDIVDYAFLFLSDLEIGPSVNIGYAVASLHAIEGRFSIGLNNRQLLIHQYRFGYRFYPLKMKKNGGRMRNLYAGAGLKSCNVHYLYNNTAFLHCSPYVSIGYRFERRRLVVDVQLNQMLALASFGTMDGAGGAAEWRFSPFPFIAKAMPLMLCGVGFVL